MRAAADRAVSLGLLALLAATAVVAWQLSSFAVLVPLFHAVLGLAWVGGFTLACAGLGYPVIRLVLRRPPSGADGVVVALAAGAGALTAVAWGLSLLGLLRPLPLQAALLLAATAGAFELRRHGFSPRWPAGLPPPVAVVLAAVGGCAFLSALTLAPFYDQWHQHLGFPALWLRQGAWVDLPRNVYGSMPANMSFLYAYALASLGPWAAQLLHWWTGVLAVAGTAGLARRLGGERPAAWAALTLATTPTIATLASTSLSDLGLAAWGAAAWLLVVDPGRPDGRDGARRLTLAGVFVGLAVGCKYVALSSVAVPVSIAAAILVLARRGEAIPTRVALGRLGALAGGALAAFAPWGVHNLLAHGNPLFPYFSRLFGLATGRDQGPAAEAARWIADFTPTGHHVLSGWTLTSLPGSGDGYPPIGVLYLALLPALAVLLLAGRFRLPAVAVACGGLAGVAAWLPALHCSRYLVGALVPVAAVLGATVVELLSPLGRLARGAITALLGTLVAFNLAMSLTPHGVLRLGSSLGQVSPEEAVAPWVTHWGAIHFVNESLPPDARLLLVAEARALLLERDLELEDGFGPPLLVELAEELPDDGAMAAALRQRGITHLLVNLQEARRMAFMAGRSDYFASSPDATRRLDRFFATRLEPLWGEHGVTVYRLR